MKWKVLNHQITVAILLSKHKIDGNIEYSPVYFNSTTKTVISSDKYMLDKSFQEILYRIDNWISDESGWTIESIEAQYVNISVYSPLIGSTYIELPSRLKHSKNGLINIKNNDNKCFLWSHIRHLNPLDKNHQRITKEDKKMINDLDYEWIKFPVSKTDYGKIERQNNIYINVFCYKNELTYPVYVSNQKSRDCMDLFLISDENKSHYVYIKDFDRFMCNKTKNKNKKYFCKCCLQCFSSEKVLIEHKENFLIINGQQSVKLKSGPISFRSYFKQLPVSFKTYADFECILNRVRSSHKNNGSYTEKYQDHIPCSFAYKFVCVDNKFSKKVVPYRGKNAVYKFIKAILEEYDYCEKMMKKHFNKNLIISAEEEEERFPLSNSCWICEKLFDVRDDKVRDHCHITGKCRGAAHWSCNVDLKLSKTIPVTFHNLRGYDSHLIIKEISKFNLKVNAIPNGLEEHMAFIINRNLVFIESMQFMNYSFDSLVKNLSDNDFKYLSEGFSSEYLKLVKPKYVYPNEYMESFKKFSEDKLPDRCKFFSSLKGKSISEKVYLKANNIWNVFKINTMGEMDKYNDLYLKVDVLLLADVFEKFINKCLGYCGLDPCHYFSSPGLSWDAMLKISEIELDLISDIEMHLFIEKGMRDGISYIAKRHSKANNKYMKCYDSSKESKYITYLDVNILYGWAMIIVDLND